MSAKARRPLPSASVTRVSHSEWVSHTYHCSPALAEELDKASKRMSEVEDLEVPVVTMDYLDDAANGGALLKIPTHTISSWGAPRHSLPVDEPNVAKTFKSRGRALGGLGYSQVASQEVLCTGPSKVKVMVKGAAAVDPESGMFVLMADGLLGESCSCVQVWRTAIMSWKMGGRCGMQC